MLCSTGVCTGVAVQSCNAGSVQYWNRSASLVEDILPDVICCQGYSMLFVQALLGGLSRWRSGAGCS